MADDSFSSEKVNLKYFAMPSRMNVFQYSWLSFDPEKTTFMYSITTWKKERESESERDEREIKESKKRERTIERSKEIR